MAEPAPPTPPPPPPKTGGDNRTLMIILAYLGILCLIPLLMEKDDAEVQWHAKHGLVLFIGAVVVGLGLMVLGMIPGLGCLSGTISLLIWPLYLVVAIIAMIKGVNGERFIIPGISPLADRF